MYSCVLCTVKSELISFCNVKSPVCFPEVKMGRVRTKTVKKAARVIIEKYYTKLTLDFDTNKRIIEEVAVIPSKPLRNKVHYLDKHRPYLSYYDDKTSYTNFS